MSIKETLIEIVAEYRGIAPSEVKTDATFREMGLDSLDVAELLLKVEDELHVVLEPSPEHDTIDKLVREKMLSLRSGQIQTRPWSAHYEQRFKRVD